MIIQQAPKAVDSDIVAAWRDSGGFWSSKAFSRKNYYQEAMTERGTQRYHDRALLSDEWFSVVTFAESHDEHYFSARSGDVTRVKAEEILGLDRPRNCKKNTANP